ncbi:unnamed protein product [Adineta steineri]|uniref:Uncharacterized protein n=1 Tax=Adineta steineri TaxID=433720 RepID=A0A813TGL0_9BILA|nr:unnamed protein product [Adineta steineri]
MYTPKYDLSRLGIVSVIFNPVRYRSRYERYDKFRDHMARSGVNLFTVECVFESATRFGLAPQRFEVTRPGNPRHIQVVAPSIMWMKENLINIAVQQLPPIIDRIAWIDADVEFEHLNWPHLTMKALDRYPIVQMFKIGYFTEPSGKKEILRRDHSFGYSIRHNKPIYPHRPHWYAHQGYAWAMHRNTFNAIGGLIDFCIVGSGDLHFAYALLGRVEETFPRGLHRDYRIQVSNWGDGVARAASNGTFVGYVDVNLYHRWHGSRANRNYTSRLSILSQYQFSPRKDLERNKRTGVLYLRDKRLFDLQSRGARIEDLEQAIVGYFISRDEDSIRVRRRVVVPKYPSQPVTLRRRRHRVVRPVTRYRPPPILKAPPIPRYYTRHSRFY